MTTSGRAAAGPLFGLLYALGAAATPEPACAAAPEPPATLSSAAAPASTAAEADAVREAQGLLADLDLWEGVPDGLADAAFIRALTAFQRLSGHAPTGALDGETLRSLRTRAEAARTARRLDAARAAETAEAEAAIAADPNLAARLAPHPGDLRADAARDLAPCRAAPTAACLLAEARETAKGIVDAELRDWALADIAAALAVEQGMDAAWPALRLTADRRAVFTGLRRVALALAAAGRDDAALAAAAASSPLPREALRTWAAVAEALSRRRPVPASAAARAEAAAEALLGAAEGGDRRAALVTLARAAHARGDGPLAARRLERAAEPGLAEEDAALVAAAWATVDAPERAAAALAALPPGVDPTPVLVELAAAWARAGDGGAALEAARAVPEARHRAVALADAAMLLRRAQALREAETAAADIPLPFAAAFAWSRITEAWRTLGDADAAEAAARRIGDDALRVEALARLADAPGLPAARAAALDAEAEVARQAVIDRVARVRLAAQRAERLSAGSGPDTAGAAVRATVEEALAVRNPWNRARVLVAAARAAAAAERGGIAVPPPPTGDR